MTETVIAKGHPEYDGIYRQWEVEKRPARLTLGNRTYQCVYTMENVVEFRIMTDGQISDEYLSTSR